jgi:phospholipase C
MRHHHLGVVSLALFAVASIVSVACSSSGVGIQAPAPNTTPAKKNHHRLKREALGNYIKHVFIIVQENRSLNNLFMGFPGANTTMTAPVEGGGDYTLVSTSFKNPCDIEHLWQDAMAAYDNGNMDGWINENPDSGCPGSYSPYFPYAYVPQSEVQPYWDIANSWVLAANFHPTEWGPSFPAHLNLIASTTEISQNEAIANLPNPPGQDIWGCDSEKGTTTWTVTPSHGPKNNGPFPCFTQFYTMADTLDKSKVPWRYYAPAVNNPTLGTIWSAFDAISNVRNGPDWSNIKHPPSQILTDIPSGALNNVGVTWVVPDWKNSDHAGSKSDTGPSWVASVVNTIGTSPLWNSSVIVVLWDDWGGWYDGSVPPQLDFRGLGIRTPMLILSPYAKQDQDAGHVSLRQFETGSILGFVENVFNLTPLEDLNGGSGSNSLGYTDQRSVGIGVTLDTSQSPRPFSTIPAAYSAQYFEAQTASYQPPDDE